MKFGSPSARGEYLVYEINESDAGLSSHKWAVAPVGTLAELHGDGGITAFPDFMNPLGELVTFEDDGVPQKLTNRYHLHESTSECLRKSIIELCVATVMRKKWRFCDRGPLVEAMAKFLLVNGWPDLHIQSVVEIAAENCGVEEELIEGCFNSIASAGRSGLINCLGDDAVRDIEGWSSLRWSLR
jgi:hypothetical protein